jgi:serine O-acetyltransferase
MTAMTWLDTVKADLRANVDPTRVFGAAFWLKLVGKLLVTPQVQVVVLFRIGSALARTPLRPLAFVLRSCSVAIGGAEIHPDATIGPGFALVHSTGVVIGPGAVIGAGCRVSQGVTLGEPGRGGDPAKWGFPTVGDHVTLGVNAVVLGSHTLGKGCVVGANSVVTSDVPEGGVVVGSPARLVRTVPLDEILNGLPEGIFDVPVR